MRWGRLPSIWGIKAYGKNKISSERNLKWQGITLLQALHKRAKDKARVCLLAGYVIKRLVD